MNTAFRAGFAQQFNQYRRAYKPVCYVGGLRRAISISSPRHLPSLKASSAGPVTLRRLCYQGAALLGGSFVTIGIGIIAFFIYDASTYKEHPTHGHVVIARQALQPRRGGPKNLPIAEDLIDDDNKGSLSGQDRKPRLVILGSGWGSVALLKGLNPDDYHVTVISPKNYFLFTPMLPSATVGTLELRSLVEPIRRILHRVNGHYIRARAEDVDIDHKLVEVCEADTEGHPFRFYVPYDKLVIAVGSISNPHGVPGLNHAFFLKDVDDARKVRNKVIRNLELACLPTTTDEERKRLLSFVICGGGPTGVEFAAELYDLLNEDVARHLPKLLRNEISVHIIQSRGHILNTYDAQVSKYAEERFARDQIAVITHARVKEVFDDKIVFTQLDADGDVLTKELPMGFCLWSTGVSQTEFCKRLASKLENYQSNRRALETDPYLRLKGTPVGDIYAIGDCATVQNDISDQIILFLQQLAYKQGKDPARLQLQFRDWQALAIDVRRRFPQAASHLKRLDKLFVDFDKDNSGTLDLKELRELLKQIDSRLTSLPATAQRANQQGLYLARVFNRLSKARSLDIRGLDSDSLSPFQYRHLGNLAYIGNSAVFDMGEGWNLSGGLWAAYAWRIVYFSQSVSFRARLSMAADWMKRTLFGRDLVAI
jgi:NADH dehydrogenase